MNIKTANRLCELRKKHGLSQEELADKLGVSRQAISKWERSESSPDTDNLIELSKIYGISLDELLNGDEAFDVIEENKEADILNKDKDDRVVITSGKNSIVIDNNGVKINDKEKTHHRDKLSEAITGVVALLVVAAYLTVGCLLPNGWACYWFMFIAIPVPGSIVKAIRKRDFSKINYPCLVTALYCALGMFLNLWHPLWILFITIPVFYSIASLIKKDYEKDDDDEDDDEDDDD